MRKFLDLFLGKMLVVILALMVVNVVWQVFTRFILGTPSSFTDELSRYLMIWLGVFGAAFVSGKNDHVAIDILQTKLSPKNRIRCQIFVKAIIIVFAVLAFIVGGSRLVYITHTLDQKSPALQMPLSLVYICIPISGILIVYYKLLDIIDTKY